MKIFKFILSLLLVLVAVSCNGSDNMDTAETTYSDTNPEVNDDTDVAASGIGLNSFNLYGEIHNILLDAVAREYQPSEYEEKEDAFLRIQQKAILSLPIADGDRISLHELLPQFKSFYREETISAYLGDSIDPNHNLALAFTTMFEEGNITENEYYILCTIYRSLKSHLDGHSTGEQLENELDDILTEWTSLYGGTDFNLIKPHRQLPDFIYDEIPYVEYENIPEGTISGTILNIILHSSEFWNNYHSNNSHDGPQHIVPYLVALDGIGAVIGLCNSTNSDWATLGKSTCFIGLAFSTFGLSKFLTD